MNDILNKNIVLVLNRNWQAIAVTTPAQAFCQMATGVVTALAITGDDEMTPMRWHDWQHLPVRESDHSVGTPHGAVRVPTVIVCARFDKVPVKRPKFSARNLWERDGGRCQYTGKKLKPGEGNIDHIVPRSRGGETSWENCVLADKKVNSRKGNKTPDEAGLKLLKNPEEPRPIPSTLTIRNDHGIKDWKPFLVS